MNRPLPHGVQPPSETTPGKHQSSTVRPAGADWPRRAPRTAPATLPAKSLARISDGELQRMDRSELIDMTRRAGEVLPRQEYLRHLPYMTREQLQQLACLARRSYRMQMQSPPR